MNRPDRERTVHAVRYFAEHTPDCVGRSLFKLLYLADVLHFQQTGQPITGLEYVARNSTPLPHALKFELEDPRQDLLDVVHIERFREEGSDRHRFAARAGVPFHADTFTRRQLGILARVAGEFGNLPHEDMPVDALDNGAWKATAINRPIDLTATLDAGDENYSDLIDLAQEYRARSAATHHYR